MFPKIRGFPPKWMVKIMENPTNMDDLVVFPLFLETPIYSLRILSWCYMHTYGISHQIAQLSLILR